MKTRLNYIGIIALIGIASFTSCEKMPDVALPTVLTNEATQITHDEAVLNATFTLDENRGSNVRRAFEISDKEETLSGHQYYYDDDWTTLTGGTTISASINSLSPETNYFYRAVLFPKDTKYSAPIYGKTMSFKTTEAPIEPSVTINTEKVTSVTSTTVRVYGNCTAVKITVTEVGFLIHRGQTPTIDNKLGVSSTKKYLKSYRSFWYKLKPATEYSVRAYAKDADGNYYYGDVMTFTTKAEPGGPLTVNDFVGTYTVNAYSPWEKKNVKWTDVQLSVYSGDTIYAKGLDNNSKYKAVGIFDKGLQVVRFESDWFFDDLSFRYGDSTVYALFTPTWYNAANDTAYHVRSGGKGGYGEIWLKKTSTNSYEFVPSDGDSDNGYYANGFIFLYESVKYFIKCGHSDVYTNVKMTRTSTTTNNNAPSRTLMQSPHIFNLQKQPQNDETECMYTAITD